MPHCVFMHKADSIYDDIPAERYQFPRPYLSRAQQCVGDWIVCLEPTKVRGSRGYFAVARVEAIVPDPTAALFVATLKRRAPGIRPAWVGLRPASLPPHKRRRPFGLAVRWSRTVHRYPS